MRLFSFMLILVLATPVLCIGQKNNTGIKVSAIRVSEAFAKPYLTEHNGPNFDVDTKGVLRAHKGYEITLNKEKRIFRIVPAGGESYQIEPGFDVEPIPGGMMWCFCNQESDDCNIQLNIGDNGLHYFCQGRCGCVKIVESDTDDILEYETLGGGWFGF